MHYVSFGQEDTSWIDYHKNMANGYRYFVRGDCNPFYTNDSIKEIKSRLNDEIRLLDVFDNEWNSDKWINQPFKYRFINNGDIYEWFARPDTSKDYLRYNTPIGMRLNGEWREKRFQDGSQTFFWGSDGYCIANTSSGFFNRMESGKWYIVIGFEWIELGKIPSDILVTIARRMNAQKWRGFFDNVIEFLVNDGLDSRNL